jgi:hypothetical protein
MKRNVKCGVHFIFSLKMMLRRSDRTLEKKLKHATPTKSEVLPSQKRKRAPSIFAAGKIVPRKKQIKKEFPEPAILPEPTLTPLEPSSSSEPSVSPPGTPITPENVPRSPPKMSEPDFSLSDHDLYSPEERVLERLRKNIQDDINKEQEQEEEDCYIVEVRDAIIDLRPLALRRKERSFTDPYGVIWVAQ